MQARLPIQVLPLEPQVRLHRPEARAVFSRRFALGGELPTPPRRARRSSARGNRQYSRRSASRRRHIHSRLRDRRDASGTATVPPHSSMWKRSLERNNGIYSGLPSKGRGTRQATGGHHGQTAGGSGIFRGNRYQLAVLDGYLLLIPDSREEMRLRAMEQQLKAQQLELAKRQMIEMLA